MPNKSKVQTHKLIERAQAVCKCGSCLTCMMEKRLRGHLEEINNLHQCVNRCLDLYTELSLVHNTALKHLKEGRTQCALRVLHPTAGDSDEIIMELALMPIVEEIHNAQVEK